MGWQRKIIVHWAISFHKFHKYENGNTQVNKTIRRDNSVNYSPEGEPIDGVTGHQINNAQQEAAQCPLQNSQAAGDAGLQFRQLFCLQVP
jgi:hypothetical protein